MTVRLLSLTFFLALVTAEDNETTTEATTTVPLSTSSTKKPFLSGLRSPCTCEEGQCGCCTGAVLDRFRQKVCTNFTYEPDDFALTASMSLNQKVLFRNTVTGKNPPPMCIRIPRLQFIRFCMRLYNIYFAKRNMHLCVDMEADWEDLTLVEWSFDCIRMGASGFAIVGPEDGGGLPASPIDVVEQTDEDYDDAARSVTGRTVGDVVFDESFTSAADHGGIESGGKGLSVERVVGGGFLVKYKKE